MIVVLCRFCSVQHNGLSKKKVKRSRLGVDLWTQYRKDHVDTFYFIYFYKIKCESLVFFRSDQAHPTEDKTTSKTQELVLKHLFLLLGYNSVEKYFHISPYTLRFVIYYLYNNIIKHKKRLYRLCVPIKSWNNYETCI